MKVLIIIPLILVLPMALGIQPINLQKQLHYLQEYKENSIDYTTCEEVQDPYDDPEYATSISDKRYTHKTLTSTTNQNEDEDRNFEDEDPDGAHPPPSAMICICDF